MEKLMMMMYPTKQKKNFIEQLKKLIKDDGLFKDSPTWYYLLLTSSSTAPPTTIADDDDSDNGGDDDKHPSTTAMIDLIDSSQKRRRSRSQHPYSNNSQPILQIQILAYHKNKSSWKDTYQQLSKIFLMMGLDESSKQPNLHRGRRGSDDDNIFHPPKPPSRGEMEKYLSALPEDFEMGMGRGLYDGF
jgi:hypothetical protein